MIRQPQKRISVLIFLFLMGMTIPFAHAKGPKKKKAQPPILLPMSALVDANSTLVLTPVGDWLPKTLIRHHLSLMDSTGGKLSFATSAKGAGGNSYVLFQAGAASGGQDMTTISGANYLESILPPSLIRTDTYINGLQATLGTYRRAGKKIQACRTFKKRRSIDFLLKITNTSENPRGFIHMYPENENVPFRANVFDEFGNLVWSTDTDESVVIQSAGTSPSLGVGATGHYQIRWKKAPKGKYTVKVDFKVSIASPWFRVRRRRPPRPPLRVSTFTMPAVTFEVTD